MYVPATFLRSKNCAIGILLLLLLIDILKLEFKGLEGSIC